MNGLGFHDPPRGLQIIAARSNGWAKSIRAGGVTDHPRRIRTRPRLCGGAGHAEPLAGPQRCRPAGANISAETVVKASPDAYTLLMVSVANTVNATHYDKLDFNSGKINTA